MLTKKPRFPIREMILFGFWPSALKRLLYRMRGYRIGKRVSIGFGSVLCGRKVVVGKDASIGFFSFVRGVEIMIGDRVAIGSGTMIDTPYLSIGDDTRINEQVFIGGLQFPDSRLTVGKNCQIMQMTFINPATWITIGDDTGIGGDSLIFGHTSWLSRFEGYPVEFRPIEIGSSVSIAWRVFVSAGAKIGDGAVIGGNSLVNRTIPPRCLATGSPAKVVGKAPHFPRCPSDEEKVTYLRDIVLEMVHYLRGHGIDSQVDDDLGLVLVRSPQRRWFRSPASQTGLGISYETPTPSTVENLHPSTRVFLSLGSIQPEIRGSLEARKVLWIDIERKERADFGNEFGDEVVLYLKRYGVRLSRPSENSPGSHATEGRNAV